MKKLSITLVDRLLATLVIVFLIPVWIINLFMCCLSFTPLIQHISKIDALGRPIVVRHFSRGLFKNSAVLIDILVNKYSFCGVSMDYDPKQKTSFSCDLPSGVFSLKELQSSVGLSDMNLRDSLRKHLANNSVAYHLGLILRGALSRLLYRDAALQSPSRFRLLDVPIDNATMTEAINWIVNCKTCKKPERANFINVNSINLAQDDVEFLATLTSAGRCFADGSGLRLGARRLGVQLRDNVNGTDLLPFLCDRMAQTGQSLFLLGAAPGVAQETAKRLKSRYPSLCIAGCHHGFFSDSENDAVVSCIKSSKADVCLVALGSPRQELWVQRFHEELGVSCTMGVGGLFDFYSGRMPRAPLWLREIGFEWLWRLKQEPVKKFRRYVIGNPVFLFHILFAKRRSHHAAI